MHLTPFLASVQERHSWERGPSRGSEQVTTQPEDETVESIDRLMSMLASSSDPEERLALGGRLGFAWLELYEREGDEDAWVYGVGWLRRSIAGGPDHPDRNRWFLGLGFGYAERGRRLGSIVDFHAAINWLSALCVGAAPGCAERGRALVLMGELSWGRYWLVRHASGIDIVRALAEVDLLLGRIDPFLMAPLDPAELTDVRLVAGLTHLERYELTGDPAQLVRGIDLLAAASIWDLAANDARRCQAGSELADALRQLSILDDDDSALDRAVAAIVRTMESASPADGTAWFLLHRYGASAANNRWLRRGNPEDLDLAYRCWQPLVALGMDPASAKEYQALLHDREETTIEPPPRP
jgi:hypothetical protein